MSKTCCVCGMDLAEGGRCVHQNANGCMDALRERVATQVKLIATLTAHNADHLAALQVHAKTIGTLQRKIEDLQETNSVINERWREDRKRLADTQQAYLVVRTLARLDEP